MALWKKDNTPGISELHCNNLSVYGTFPTIIFYGLVIVEGFKDGSDIKEEIFMWGYKVIIRQVSTYGVCQGFLYRFAKE